MKWLQNILEFRVVTISAGELLGSFLFGVLRRQQC
ncbi:MAG: hypothetical protein ACI8XO_002411 [Verrucomicrobiales bacterium]|jgi:hypothetical protein